MKTNMQPRIETSTGKKLIGMRLTMTFADNKTYKLWQSFMPRRKEIKNNLTTELISIQVYDRSYDFSKFNTHTEFDKWATVEVSDFSTIPDKMEGYTLSPGLYAVFPYKGLSTGTEIFEYI